jgi:hypothetical protein
MGTKTRLMWLLLLLGVAVGGCGGSSTAAFESIPPGEAGGPCLQGAVCSDGLTCEAGVCGQHWKWDVAGLEDDSLSEAGALGELATEPDSGGQPGDGGQDLGLMEVQPQPDTETPVEISEGKDSLLGTDSGLDADQGCLPESHHTWGCWEGDLWWFDSCGTAEEVKELCPGVCADDLCAEVCVDECAVNQTGCNGDLQRWYCGLADDGDPCRDKLYETCEGGTACQAGQCKITCTHECNLGNLGCDDDETRWYCGDAGDGDPCRDRIYEGCDWGLECSGGQCLETCNDECSQGEQDCDDDETRWYCGDADDGDSCRDIVYASCSSTQICDGGDCVSCTKHDYQDCIFNTVMWFDCKGVSNDTVKDCGLCSCASAQCKCGPSSVIIDSHDASGWSMGSPSDSIFKASDHTDGSPDGWFNTKGYNKNIRYTPNFGGDGTFGRWRTSQALTGVYKLYYHVPDPDSYDPYLGLYSVKSWIRCSSVKYWVKTMSNQSGDGLGVTASQASPGWNLLGSYSFQNTVGEVTLKDYNASPSKCAVAFDAVKWELQAP